ncbi:hypothetical protein [Pelorhabdus rhamnosifermentans]|uniref:hypothetical protein n=1 Tax=Pelorhabdus rhamnosifermentans TaxID=2772457 RepID=UPI0028AA5B64|nr:hypothetical protein [Pelorhabdus rhamnosifermentans]
MGRLQNNNYEKDGVKHYETEIVAEFIGISIKDSKQQQQTPANGIESNIPDKYAKDGGGAFPTDETGTLKPN